MIPSVRMALSTLVVATTTSVAGQAQSAPTDYRDEFLDHFQRSTSKLVQLSNAMPADLYTWSPGEGVMTVARVYAHIARYNYMYLEEQLGITAPPGVDWSNLESLTDKATVVQALEASIDYVKQATTHMSEDALTETTMLYGRRVAGWAVLFQLLAHMNEHTGQSIAYARMNGVVPPWSR